MILGELHTQIMLEVTTNQQYNWIIYINSTVTTAGQKLVILQLITHSSLVKFFLHQQGMDQENVGITFICLE